MVATEYMCIMVQGFWEKEMGEKKKKKKDFFFCTKCDLHH